MSTHALDVPDPKPDMPKDLAEATRASYECAPDWLDGRPIPWEDISSQDRAMYCWRFANGLAELFSSAEDWQKKSAEYLSFCRRGAA